MVEERTLGEPVAPRSLKLTPRQGEILRLMCQGKSNKEIANVLDISLGTVKQHVVALFKRMDVRNRSMAVSQAMALVDGGAESAEAPAAQNKMLPQRSREGFLVRRPCHVVSFRAAHLRASADRNRFNKLLAALAFDANALYVPDESGGGELLLGVRSVSEWDVLTALLLVYQLCNQVGLSQLADPAGISASICCGLAVIGVDGKGRWSGDTVATQVTAAARSAVRQCGQGDLYLSANALGMLRALHGHNSQAGVQTFSVLRVEELIKLDFQQSRKPVGREAQYQQLEQALLASSVHGQFQLVGRVGSGKTHLCRALFARAQQLGVAGRYFRIFPGPHFVDALTGKVVAVKDVMESCRSIASNGMSLLILDDFDLLNDEIRTQLLQCIGAESHRPGLCVFTSQDVTINAVETIKLEGLSAHELEMVLCERGQSFGTGAIGRQELAKTARGLPLFALELTESDGEQLSLPALVAVVCQVNKSNLDWQLLGQIAKQGVEATHIDPAALSSAVSAGILECSCQDGSLIFPTPLLQQAFASLVV